MAKLSVWFIGFLAVQTLACGTPNPALTPETGEVDMQAPIINGHAASLRDAPATGALLVRGVDARRRGYTGICTGTLIAPDVVLTAAHCQQEAAGARARYFFSLALDVTEAGSTMRTMPKRTYAANATWPHPQYNFPDRPGLGRANDVALVFLDQPVRGVTPARMLSPAEASVVRVNAPVTIVGYGRRSEPEPGDDSDDDGIEKSTAESVISEVGPYEVQVGHGLPEPEKCYGDSGGPTYISTSRGTRLLGITSRLYDVIDTTDPRMGAKDEAGDFHKGTVDGRVDAFYAWINQTMADACDNGVRLKSACGAAD